MSSQMSRGIYCSTCKKEKGIGCKNDNRCKSCKSNYEKQRRIKKRLAAGKTAERPVRTAWCDECKSNLTQGLDIRGKCKSCCNLAEDKRREIIRQDLGKPQVIKDRGIFCYKCNIPKTNGRCLPCRYEAVRQRKIRKRKEAGKRAWGSGRPLTCYGCGNIKEHPKWSYCNSCQSARDRINWSQKISVRVNRPQKTDRCACGLTRAPYSKSYCRSCLAKRSKDYRKNLHLTGQVKPRPKLTDEEKKIRKNARDFVNLAVRKGLMFPKPCEVCNTKFNLEAHHDDYSKPLDIRWLCRDHHVEHHLNVLHET